MERLDTVVIGAGVVGLAVARALALAGRDVVVVESADAIGTATSSRNSEVIHAGIYYAKDSRKARTCVAGKHRLYAYCEDRGIEHKRCGKFIVATNEAQAEALAGIKERAAANGVADLQWRTGADVRASEPAVSCAAALWSPSTGIVDSHGLMLALEGDLEDAGGPIAFNTEVVELVAESAGIVVRTAGAEPMDVLATTVVNAAGLSAPQIAGRTKGLRQEHVPTAHYCKGNYFTLAGKNPFGRLIYPVPEAHGLGVHVTVDLGGQARFGPDVEWVEAVNYDVEPARADAFYAAIRRYWPDLPDGALVPGYSGIRPKLGPAGTPAADFRIDGPKVHGIAGLINLFGIESPGLTASLALADEVLTALAERANASHAA